jgi:flavin reductase (DIM6/NTAB) family NADH-FMN oxidoreductase RutF
MEGLLGQLGRKPSRERRKVIFDPAAIPWGDSYKLITGSILPRPIAFVATCSVDGRENLAPFSFFTVVCANPLTICFSPMRKGPEALEKDTLANIRATGEFVVNVVDEAFVERMNLCAAEFESGVSEFEMSGLTPRPAVAVRPSLVAESPVSLECRLLQIVDVSDKPGGGSLVMGTVVRIHVRDDLYQNGRVVTEGWRPVGRLAGAAYCRLTDTFELERPSVTEAIEAKKALAP